MFQRSPFDDAKIVRHGRRHAEAMLEAAFFVFEAREPTAAELADLADAADAFARARYPMAVTLAAAAIEGRSKARSEWLPVMPRSLEHVQTMVAAARQSGAAAANQDI